MRLTRMIPNTLSFMVIIFGKGSGVVAAILVFPEGEMTRADAITKFGADFEKSNKTRALPDCSREKAFRAGTYRLQ